MEFQSIRKNIALFSVSAMSVAVTGGASLAYAESYVQEQEAMEFTTEQSAIDRAVLSDSAHEDLKKMLENADPSLGDRVPGFSSITDVESTTSVAISTEETDMVSMQPSEASDDSGR